MLEVPLKVLGGRLKIAIIVWVQAACTEFTSQLETDDVLRCLAV